MENLKDSYQCKQTSTDQVLIQSSPTSNPENQKKKKKKIGKNLTDKPTTDHVTTHGKPNEQLFTKHVVI